MAKTLSDTQLIILSGACQRDNRNVYPLNTNLTGGALSKVLASLLGKGLLEEVPANLQDQDTVWQTDDGGNRLTLRATPDAEAALGIGEAAAEPQEGGDKAKARQHRRGRKAIRASGRQDSGPKSKGKGAPTKRASVGRTKPKGGKSRSGTKQAKLVEMLQRKQGATVDEVVKALDWQPHTVRGAIAGVLKKKLGLKVGSEKVEGRGRIYRIAV